MPPKQRSKVKLNSKRNRMILPHKVTQTAQHAQAVVAALPIADDATTGSPQHVRHATQRQVKPRTKKVAMAPPPPQHVRHATQRHVKPRTKKVAMAPPPPQHVRHATQRHVKPRTKKVAMAPPLSQPNEVHESDPLMIRTPGFVPQDPTTDHSPSHPLTSVSSRHTPPSNDASPLIPAPIDATTQCSRNSRPIPDVAPDGRPMIRPDGKGWLPCRVASRALTKVIESQFVDPYSSWGEIVDTTVTKWLENFGERVAWLPQHDYQIKEIFKYKGSRRLSEMLSHARKQGERPGWMGEGVWKDLLAKWIKPSFKQISARAKKNRASAKGGSVHTGGSISVGEITIRMAEDLGREPTLDEVFLKTHIKKRDSTWVDERAKNTYETFQEKLNQVSQNGSSTLDDATRLNMWVQSVGGKKRGRLYGAGDRSSLYRQGITSFTPDYRLSRGCTQVPSQYSEEMATHIAAVEARAKAAEDEARQTREELQRVEQSRKEEVQQAEQRAADFQRQLAILAKSVASIQAESSRRRHLDYDEDGDESESHDDGEYL